MSQDNRSQSNNSSHSTLFQQMFTDRTRNMSQDNQDNNNIFTAFNNFKKNFQGDPEAKVRELLASGKMTQQQFDDLSSKARYFMGMFGF